MPRLVMTSAERRLLRWLIAGGVLAVGWFAHRGVWLVW
jgi:streptomycin 6-kinase